MRCLGRIRNGAALHSLYWAGGRDHSSDAAGAGGLAALDDAASTLSLFAGLELFLNNVLEPVLYGAHTGVSSIALIVAAVFWTWLWGPLGLVLATPLTVCLVVMGRHVPRLSFLSIVLSDEEALTPAEDCYHRLLTPGERDELELVESYLKANSLTALYDSVFIPVLTAAETDARADLLEPGNSVNWSRACATSSKTSVFARPVPSKAAAEKVESAADDRRLDRRRLLWIAAFFACPPCGSR